jgi:hypothetical protein
LCAWFSFCCFLRNFPFLYQILRKDLSPLFAKGNEVNQYHTFHLGVIAYCHPASQSLQPLANYPLQPSACRSESDHLGSLLWLLCDVQHRAGNKHYNCVDGIRNDSSSPPIKLIIFDLRYKDFVFPFSFFFCITKYYFHSIPTAK